jgi:NAD(P)-dependent dehydrogenase (short-subunit alcohol dehydrogenase family)
MTHPVALVTGATSGIGEATARTLARRGVKVVVSGRRLDLGEEVAASIQSEDGCDAIFLQADVSSETAIHDLVEQTIEHYGRLDYGINNAAIAIETSKLAECDSDKFQQMLQTNVMGVFWCMKYQIEQMLKQGNGSIVNLASIAGLNGIPWVSTYSATKHAVVGLTKSAALDYATQNIRINAVAPGAIKTDIIEQQIAMGTYDEQMIVAMEPMGRMGKAQEIANGIAWLCSDEASFVTGEILSIDGAFNAK